MEFKIEKNIPIPQDYNRGGKGKSPFRLLLEAMEVGDSALIPSENTSQSALYQALRRARQSLGRKFTVRKKPEGIRVWRIE